MSGPDAGKSVELKRTPFVVGKGDECDLALKDPSVSRAHLRIETEGGAYIVRDLSSTNGTFVDQFRVREAWLRPGVIVRAGSAELRFDAGFAPVDVAPSAHDHFQSLLGQSTRMRQLFGLLNTVAPSDATVVILGETGTGKSAVARAIHDASPRKDKPFVTVDCGAIAENLIESELFGHEKGAFTGAEKTRVGAIERAQGGTLFLDELVDLRLDLQPRLLRVLEERELRRVGGNDAIKLDVRVVAASRFDLWAEVEARRFREDLYFRLAVFCLALPPLRERPEDIWPLAQHFAGAKPLLPLSADATARLKAHPFMGNVRELRNVVERASLFGGDLGVVLETMPPARTTTTTTTTTQKPTTTTTTTTTAAASAAGDGDVLTVSVDPRLSFKEAKDLILERFELAYAERLLANYHGNISHLAREAGIDRKYLYTLLKKHGLPLPDRE